MIAPWRKLRRAIAPKRATEMILTFRCGCSADGKTVNAFGEPTLNRGAMRIEPLEMAAECPEHGPTYCVDVIEVDLPVKGSDVAS